MKKYFAQYQENIFLSGLLYLVILLLFILPRVLIPASWSASLQGMLAGLVAYTLRLHLLLLLVMGILIFKPLREKLRSINYKTWLALALVLGLGFYLFWSVGPFTHRVYFDEDIYMNIGANIAHQNVALKTNLGTPNHCYDGEYNKDPSGMPALLSVFYSIFGVDEYLSSRITVSVSLLSALLLFLIAYLIFGQELLALFAAFIFILMPENIIWAPTVAAEPYLVFFSALTLLGLVLYAQTWDNKALIFSLFSLAYAAQIRPEGILLLIPLQLFLFFSRDFKGKALEPTFIAGWILFFLLLLPQFLTFAAFRGESWGATGPMFGLNYFYNNFRANLFYFSENTRWPIIFSALALIGIFPFRKWFKEKVSLIFFFLVFFAFFLFFYAGSYNYGTDVRFSLILNLPLAILAAAGIYLINNSIFKKINFVVINLIWIILILWSFKMVYPAIPIGEESIDARTSHDYMVKVLHRLPKNSYVLSYDPCIVVINGQSGAQTFYAEREGVMHRIMAESSGVYFFQDVWSQIPPYRDEWRTMFKVYKLERMPGLAFRQYTFDLYRISK